MSSKYKIHPINTSSPSSSHTAATPKHGGAPRSSFSQPLSRNVSNNNLMEDESSLLFEDQALSESGKNFGRSSGAGSKLKRFNSFSALSSSTNTSSATAATNTATASSTASSHNGAGRYARTVNEIRSSPHTAVSVLLSPSLPRSSRKSLSQSSANKHAPSTQHTQPQQQSRSRGNSMNEDSAQALLNAPNSGNGNGNGNGTSSRRNSVDGSNRRRLSLEDEITEISLTNVTQAPREGTRSRLNSSDNTHTSHGYGVSRTPSTHSQKSSLRKPHNHTSHTHGRRKRVQFRSPIADYSECKADYEYGPEDEEGNTFSFSQSISAIPRRLMRKQSQRELQAGGGCVPGCAVM